MNDSGPMTPDSALPGSPVRAAGLAKKDLCNGVSDPTRESMSSMSTMTNSIVTRDSNLSAGRNSAFRRATSHLDQVLVRDLLILKRLACYSSG